MPKSQQPTPPSPTKQRQTIAPPPPYKPSQTPAPTLPRFTTPIPEPSINLPSIWQAPTHTPTPTPTATPDINKDISEAIDFLFGKDLSGVDFTDLLPGPMYFNTPKGPVLVNLRAIGEMFDKVGTTIWWIKDVFQK